MLALVVVGLFLGPLSPSATAHAGSHGHSHSQTHAAHHEAPAPDSGDPSGHGHGLAHCSTFSCAPSVAGTPVTAEAYAEVGFSELTYCFSNRPLRSLYLDSDPPVPKA